MQFNDSEAATFWRFFGITTTNCQTRRYQLQLITDYIKNYDDITDEKADQLMSAALALETQRTELKRSTSTS